jgi:SAM-dependent methyltransferase
MAISASRNLTRMTNLSARPAPAESCPACRVASTELVFSVTAEEAAQHFILGKADPQSHDRLKRHIIALWGQETCDIRKCIACGFGFANPFVAGDARFYNLAYPRLNYPAVKWEYQATEKLLANRAVRVAGDVIDVGAGFGFFLDRISAELGNDRRYLAIEYHDRAAECLAKKGYAVVKDDLRSEQFDTCQGRFAYMFLFQVVEHMNALDPLFQRIHDLLAEGGSAFVAVPNTARTDFQERTDSLIDMPPNHIGRWTTDAFDAVAERAGLRVLATHYEPFSLIEASKVDLKYFHLKRAQAPGTLAHRVRCLPASKARTFIEAALALAAAPVRVPLLLQAASSGIPLGYSMLVELGRLA